jgi:hypothetical protein
VRVQMGHRHRRCRHRWKEGMTAASAERATQSRRGRRGDAGSRPARADHNGPWTSRKFICASSSDFVLAPIEENRLDVVLYAIRE